MKDLMKAKSFIQAKLDMIQNEPEIIQNVVDALVNNDELEVNDEEFYQYNFGDKFYVSDMLNEWHEYARIAYIRMQIAKNRDFVSVANLNSTIFINNFVEKFLK